MSSLMQAEEIAWLNEWMVEAKRPGMVSFLCSMARHGRLDRAMAKDSAPEWPVGLGKKIVCKPNMKFRAIGYKEAVFFVSRIVGIEMDPWFKGDDKLDQSLAVKARVFQPTVWTQQMSWFSLKKRHTWTHKSNNHNAHNINRNNNKKRSY